MKEKTIKDIISNGRWNWYGENEDMSDTVKTDFENYCSRMWLDNCDENNAYGSTSYSKEEYVTKFRDYLTEKFNKDNGIVKNEN